MKTHSVGVLILMTTIVASACSEDATAPILEENTFEARVEGAESTTFRGTGEFHLGNDLHRPGSPLVFSLASFADRPDGGRDAFQFFRDGGLPSTAKRTHTIGLVGADFGAIFTRSSADGASMTAYAADEGEIEITVSTPERLEGTFRFRGFRYCAVTPATREGPCRVPESVIAGAPTIEVTGSFSAVPFGSTPVTEQILPAAIQFHSDPIVIELPTVADREQPFEVRVRSYGSGCTAKSHTEVQRQGLSAVVAPFNRELGGGAICPQVLRMIDHVAVLSFDQPGTARVLVRGRREPGGQPVEFERNVTIR